MDKFLHTSVRLNTDLGRATRFFTHPDQLQRWFCEKADLSPDGKEMKLGSISMPDDSWTWLFESVQRERHILLTCPDLFHKIENGSFAVEVQLMKCTSLTEYCSEIHILQRGFDASAEADALRACYGELWTQKLEALRTLVNGKWIIEDRDLTLEIFR